MKLTNILLGESLHYEPEFEREVERIKKLGGVYLGSGDYGAVYRVGDRAVKVTTDLDELNHAEIIKGKKTNNFVPIYDVKRVGDKVGTIEMMLMENTNSPIPDEFLDALEAEAKRLGIDPDELNLKSDNFMIHPKSKKFKMTDL